MEALKRLGERPSVTTATDSAGEIEPAGSGALSPRRVGKATNLAARCSTASRHARAVVPRQSGRCTSELVRPGLVLPGLPASFRRPTPTHGRIGTCEPNDVATRRRKLHGAQPTLLDQNGFASGRAQCLKKNSMLSQRVSGAPAGHCLLGNQRAPTPVEQPAALSGVRPLLIQPILLRLTSPVNLNFPRNLFP